MKTKGTFSFLYVLGACKLESKIGTSILFNMPNYIRYLYSPKRGDVPYASFPPISGGSDTIVFSAREYRLHFRLKVTI